MEDDIWKDSIRECETVLVLSNRLEEFIIGIGDEESCVDNVWECKTGLLVPNEAEGEIRRVALEGNWEATVRENVMGLMLSDTLEEAMIEIGRVKSFVDTTAGDKTVLLSSNELEGEVEEVTDDNWKDTLLVNVIDVMYLSKLGEELSEIGKEDN